MFNLLTIGDVARELGVPRTSLDYAIQKVGIRERGRAGILRLFSRDQVPAIQAALSTIRQRGRKTEAEVAARLFRQQGSGGE